MAESSGHTRSQRTPSETHCRTIIASNHPNCHSLPLEGWVLNVDCLLPCSCCAVKPILRKVWMRSSRIRAWYTVSLWVHQTQPAFSNESDKSLQFPGDTRNLNVRATLPYCSQRDSASYLARLVPLVTSGRLIPDCWGRIESKEWVPQPQINTGLAEYLLIPWLGRGLVAFVSAKSGRRTERC